MTDQQRKEKQEQLAQELEKTYFEDPFDEEDSTTDDAMESPENSWSKESSNGSFGSLISILLYRLEVQIGILLGSLAILIVLLFGLVNGVGFLTMLWRVPLFGIIFFAIGFILVFMVRRISPQAFEDEASFFPENFRKRNKVDFTVDDSHDHGDRSDLGSEKNKNEAEEAELKRARKRSIEDLENDPDFIHLRDGSTIPKDPELLAHAIKTVMNRDKNA